MAEPRDRRIGIVSTRLAGTDGVSLEAAKWSEVLERLGFQCFYMAGLLDRPADRSRLVPEAHYRHPEIVAITSALFSGDWQTMAEADAEHPFIRRRDFFSPYVRPPHVAQRIDELKAHLKAATYGFIRDFDLDALIVENALAIPLHVPLGLALTEVIAETGIPVIAHHHDLPWERARFAVNSASDYIAAAFPPALPSVRHVVINSGQSKALAWRTGLASRVIPNVMDFDHPPPAPDGYGDRACADLGIGPDEALILQPTRIIQRKGIEHAIELVRRLDRPARLVITHAGGDEGDAYEQRVREFAHLLDVPVRFEAEVVAPVRGETPDGRRIYALDDIYPLADLVTYPSSSEGFGNAFLEAVFHRRPLVVNRYSTYELDIRPLGFRVVEFSDFISEATLEGARRLLDEPDLAAAWADVNYDLARRHFSFAILERRLLDVVVEALGDRSANGGP
jgi:glycosyltransferase involved in cell wall biosynthesis